MSPPASRQQEISATEYEEILEQSGGFGRFQIRIFVLVSLFETPVAWAMVLPVFTGASSKWTCPANGTAGNETVSQNGSLCEICPGIQYTADFTSIKTEWNLVCERDYIPDLITSLQMLGVLVGALVTGQLADMYGRRRLLFLAYGWLLGVWLVSAFSSSWQMYTALRMLVGAGIGGVMVVNFVLPLEFVTPRWRTFCGCIGFWAVGVMTLGLWGYLIRDWRHVTIATAVTGIPLLLCWWWVPESPRWLLSKGRMDEAKTILHNMAITNKKPLPELGSLQRFTEREQMVYQERKKYSYWHLCSSWRLARNTLILMYGWFVSSSVYYGFILNVKNLAGDRYVNLFLSGLMELPAVIFVVLVNNRLGRRRTTCLLMMTAGLSCGVILVFAVLKKLEMWPSAVITFAMLGKFGISGAWATVQVFSAETFPTVVRNIGVGSCSMSARIGGIVAPQFVFLSKFSDSIPYMIFGGTAVTCAILALALPETNKVPLPDQLENGKSNGHMITSVNQDHALEDIPLSQDT